MTRWTVVTIVAVSVLACPVLAATVDEAALAAKVTALTQRLEDARQAETQGQVSRGSVVAVERDLLDAELALAQVRGDAKALPGLLERQVALEEAEVKRVQALEGTGVVGGGSLAKALERLVAARTRLAESRGMRADVKADLERMVAARQFELDRVQEAAGRGLVSGARVAKAEEALAAAQARLEEALKPPPPDEPAPDEGEDTLD